MSLEKLFGAKSEAVRRWLGMDEGKVFLDALREKRVEANKDLRERKDVVDLYRAQGKSEILTWILGLREDLSETPKK